MLTGPGGNIAVATAENGSLIVDSGVPTRAVDIDKAVHAILDRPVLTLVNTHWHFDHAGGNEHFGRNAARIIATANARKRLGTDQVIEAFNREMPASPAAALPALTIDSTATIHHGDHTIALHAMPPAHTDGDLVLVFEKDDVIHCGDLFFNGLYPFIDYSSGGWIGGMIAAADRIIAMASDRTRIIPGHGPLSDKRGLQAFRDMLAKVSDAITPMVKAGRSVEDVVAAKPTRELDATWGGGLFNPDQFTTVVYHGIVRHGR